MERLGRSVQLGSAGFALAMLVWAGSVHAQGTAAEASNPAEIVAARELFRQGTEDADAGRFADGLEKFKRVAAVKETAAVRFNIARCEEALGRTGGALADFELAAREGREDPKAQDVAKVAAERADALRPRVARLTLFAPPQVPPGMAVSLDGSKLATATLGVGLPLDPGLHVVDATSPGRSPFHVELTLAPGESRSVTLTLSSSSPPTPDAVSPGEPQRSATAPASSSSAPSTQRMLGWVTIAAGGALGAASGVFLLLRNHAVENATSSIQTECAAASGTASTSTSTIHCPPALQGQIAGQLASAQSTVNADEAAAITLVAASGVAILGGLLLVVTAPRGPAASSGASSGSGAATRNLGITASAPGALAGLSIHGSF